MLIRLTGSLGDEVALTGFVRELRRHTGEPITVQNRYPELFENNPRLAGAAPDSGRCIQLRWGPPGGEVCKYMAAGNFVHEYARQAGLTCVINGDPELFLTADECEWGASKLDHALPWRCHATIGIDTWAGWPRRRWPFEAWVELVRLLRADGYTIVELGKRAGDCTGAIHDRQLPETDASFFDQCTVRQTAALLRNMDLFIGADSGLVHLAAAVGTPQVALYSVPWFWRAYSTTRPLFGIGFGCGDCSEVCAHNQACLRAIRPVDVQAAVREVAPPA